LCSAVINAVRLRNVAKISDDVDVVILMLPNLERTEYLVRAAREYGIIMKTVQVLKPPPGAMPYYQNVMTKLRIFELYEYERVIFLDSDSLVLENALDELFDLPADVHLAIPRCYWDDLGVVTSVLLVVKPSTELWTRIMKYYNENGHPTHTKMYDMDLINKEFRDEKLVLPGTYGLLNTLWENRELTHVPAFSNMSLNEVRSMAHFVHFSGPAGKPWQCVNPSNIKRIRPNAHPFFYEVFDTWCAEKEMLQSKDGCGFRIKGYEWSLSQILSAVYFEMRFDQSLTSIVFYCC